MFWEVSKKAAQDLDDIFDYTCSEFGVDQAYQYVTAFDIVFDRLLTNPKLGHDYGEIRKGLRSVIKESHVVFYVIKKDRILILRILHGSRDLPKFLRQPL